jgi:hypothetical protein
LFCYFYVMMGEGTMANNRYRPGWDNQRTIPARPGQDRYTNKDSWLPCIKNARTKTERLDCLNKVQQERPNDPVVRAMIYQEVKEVVDRDPFLEYHAENTNAYRVIDRAQQVLIVPKERAVPESYPVRRPEPVRMAYRYLLYVALGLILSGLGAVIFAPFAWRYAFRAYRQTRSRADRVRAGVAAALVLALFALGLALTYLFWIHIRG